MNRKGAIPIMLILGIAGAIVVFIAFAALGIGLFDFLKSNWVWILVITAAYLVLFKMKLLKGLYKR